MIDHCKTFEIRSIPDKRGSLSYLESVHDFAFEFKRLYYLYDVPDGEVRGSHAHKKLKQILVCLHGSVDVILFDGKLKKRITLADPNLGLYICPMIWRDLQNFKNDAVLAVIASEHYDESDYIRDINQFIELSKLDNQS